MPLVVFTQREETFYFSLGEGLTFYGHTICIFPEEYFLNPLIVRIFHKYCVIVLLSRVQVGIIARVRSPWLLINTTFDFLTVSVVFRVFSFLLPYLYLF